MAILLSFDFTKTTKTISCFYYTMDFGEMQAFFDKNCEVYLVY